MKQLIYKMSFLLFGVIFMFSCESNDIETIGDEDPTLIQFENSSLTLATPEDGITEEVDVILSSTSSQERRITVEIDPQSTADTDQYQVSDIVVPAGSYRGTLTISGNFDAIPESGSSSLILNVVDVEGESDFIVENGQLNIELFRRCSITLDQLVGTWSGIDSWGYPTQFETFIEDGQLKMTPGLVFGWMEDYWGEPIISQEPAVNLNVDLETFAITIPEQPYITTTWQGDEYEYTISGTGVVVNSCDRVIRINPVLATGGSALDGSANGPAFSVTLQGDMVDSGEPGGEPGDGSEEDDSNEDDSEDE